MVEVLFVCLTTIIITSIIVGFFIYRLKVTNHTSNLQQSLSTIDNEIKSMKAKLTALELRR